MQLVLEATLTWPDLPYERRAPPLRCLRVHGGRGCAAQLGLEDSSGLKGLLAGRLACRTRILGSTLGRSPVVVRWRPLKTG